MHNWNTSNILVLENNINTSDGFYNQQLNTIIKHIPVAAPYPSQSKKEGSNAPVASEPPVKLTRNVRLNIQTSVPLKSEAEIDAYLQGLKKQLMTFIDSDCEVMITK